MDEMEPTVNNTDLPVTAADLPLSEEVPITKPKPRQRKPRRKKEVLPKHDKPIENGGSRPISPVSSLVKERIYSKPGRTNNTKNTEKLPSIQDAVCIYAKLRNDGTRPPVFLQRNLVYLGRSPISNRRTGDVDQIASELSSQAVEGEEMEFSIANIQNISTGTIPDKAEIKVKVFMQKKCFKRRKIVKASNEKPWTVSTYIKRTNTRPPYCSIQQVKLVSLKAVTLFTCSLVMRLSQYLSVCVTFVRGTGNDPAQYAFPTCSVSPLVNRFDSLPNTKRKEWNGLSASSLLELDIQRKVVNRRNLRPTCKLPLSPSKSHTTSPSKYHTMSPSKSQPVALNGLSTAKSLTDSAAQPLAEPQSSDIPPTSQSQEGSEMLTPACSSEKNRVYMVMMHKGAPQTTVHSDYDCPFCRKKTRPACLKFLLKHLRLCHDRLQFLYKESDDIICVNVNPFLDGSYAGNPIDVVPGLLGSKTKSAAEEKREPRRRKSFTEIINLHCNRKPVTLEEFTRVEPISAASSSVPVGHNRLYYHSMRNTPMLSNDFDYDSDGDDEDWKKIASMRLIDDFIDVNKGEKDMMKLWNQFMTHNSHIISDMQMETACRQFLQLHSDVIAYKLRNNFLCHLATLYDCGCLSAPQMANIIREMPSRRATTNGYHLKDK